MVNTGTFIAYHVKMSLKHNSRFILCSFASCFLDDYIMAVILINPQTSLFCEIYKEIADSLLIS